MAIPDLIVDRIATPGVMAAKLLLPWGSATDGVGQRGAHQLLAATLSRGCGPFDHRQLADLVEGRGAGLRSDAHEDGLLISLRCTTEDAQELMPLLDWMVTAPHLATEQLELERSLSLQALQRQREDPFHLAIDQWRQLVYGSTGYGHDPLGVSDDLQRLDATVLQTLARQLTTGRSVLAISGTWPSSLDDTLLKRTGEGWQDTTDAPPPPPMHWTPNGDGDLVMQSIDTEQVVLMLGQPCCAYGHPDDLALRLLQCHLGSGMSSLLFRRLREDHGVAYDVGAHHPARAGAAPFVLHASSSAERAELTLSLLHQSWHELSSQPLSEADLTLARAKFRGQVAHGLQTCSQRAERAAHRRGLGLSDDHDHRSLERMESLQPQELMEAAQRWLQTPHLSLCGPADALKRLEDHWSQLQSSAATGSS